MSLTYWLRDYESGDIALAIRIKGTFKLISRYSKLYGNKNPNSPYCEKINQVTEDLFDVATGGDFDSRKKNVSKSKAKATARKCIEAKSLLHEVLVTL